jgi:hypothetical protein
LGLKSQLVAALVAALCICGCGSGVGGKASSTVTIEPKDLRLGDEADSGGSAQPVKYD